MIKLVFLIFLIISLYLLLNKSNENFEAPVPYISYDGLLDGGIQKVTFTYEKGDKGPRGDPGKNAPNKNIEYYFERLFKPSDVVEQEPVQVPIVKETQTETNTEYKGCFKDKNSRALTINKGLKDAGKCALEAYEANSPVYGLQFVGLDSNGNMNRLPQCWIAGLGDDYKKYGENNTGCRNIDGINYGLAWHNAVYDTIVTLSQTKTEIIGNKYRNTEFNNPLKIVKLPQKYEFGCTFKLIEDVKNNKWRSIFQVASNLNKENCCEWGSRLPGGWIHPNNNRLHIVYGSKGSSVEVTNKKYNSPQELSVNVEYNIVVQLYSNKVIIYINGTKIHEDTRDGDTSDLKPAFVYGGSYFSNNYQYGKIAIKNMYMKAL
jgi:hypothetical protein